MDINSSASLAAAFLGYLLAGYERFQSNKAGKRATESKALAAAAEKERAVNQAILEGHKRLVEIAQGSADSWRKRHDEGEEEYRKYRQEQHDKARVDNAIHLQLTLENETLKAKTDVSPIMAWQEGQNKINAQLLEAIGNLNKNMTEGNAAMIKRIEELSRERSEKESHG